MISSNGPVVKIMSSVFVDISVICASHFCDVVLSGN